MTVNISARNYRIWVCRPNETEADGLEVTQACSGQGSGFFTCGDEPIAEDGRIRTTGTLVLATLPNFIESLDSDINPARWAVGNRIVVKVEDSAGVLRLHPRSGLRIAEVPDRPYPGRNSITLQLVDSLTLCDYRQPDDDKSGINFGQSADRGSIIKALLKDAKLDFNGSIPEYPIAYPIPKQDGSFVGQAGVVAIGAQKALWVDNQGVIRAIPLILNQNQPLLSRTIGLDEAGYEPLPPGELPCELVKAVGTGQEVKPLNDSGSTNAEEFAPRESIVPGTGLSNTLSARTREHWEWSGNSFKRSVSRYEARGTVLPDAFFKEIGRSAPGSAFSLVFKESTEDLKIYEGGKEGRLLRQIVTTTQPRGVVFNEYYKNHPPKKDDVIPWFQPIVASETVTIYEYGKDSMTRRIYTVVRQPRGSIAGPADDWQTIPNLTSAAFAQSNEKTWFEQNKSEWRSTEQVKRSGIVQSGTIAAFLSSATTKNEVTTSRSGQNQPPAAERRAPKYNQEEKQYKGQAKFKPLAGAAFVDRTHTHQFQYVVSDDQLNGLAKLFGTLRHGRHRGFRLTTEFDDAWFDYQPFARIDAVDGDKILQGWVDSCTWTLADSEAIVIADCGLVGTAAIVPGEPMTAGVQPPFVVAIDIYGRSRKRVGHFAVYPYPLHPEPIEIYGRSRGRVGHFTILQPPIEIYGRSRGRVGRFELPIEIYGRSRKRVGHFTFPVQNTLAAGLAAGWDFNDSLAPSFGDSTLSGTATYTNGLNAGRALRLSNTDESIITLSTASTEALAIGAESFTIAAVVNFGDNFYSLNLISKNEATAASLEYAINVVGGGGEDIYVNFRSRLGNVQLSGGNSPPAIGGTYLIVFWQNFPIQEMGIEAREISTGNIYTNVRTGLGYSTLPSYAAGTATFKIGGSGYEFDFQRLWMDKTALWKRSLSQGDRDALYDDGFPF